MGFKQTRRWWAICFAVAGTFILCGCGGPDTKGTEPVDTVSGQWETEYIRDHQYMDGRIFDLAYPGEIGPNDRVNIQVWEEETDTRNPDAKKMYMDAGPGLNTYDSQDVLMREVPADHYELMYGRDTTYCPAALVFYNGRRRAVGVYMEITRYSSSDVSTGVIDTIGWTGDGPDTVRIIQPIQAHNVPDHPAWNLMWRNCYRILRNFRYDDVDIKVYKGAIGNEGGADCLDYQVVDHVAQRFYIQILGLDQYNSKGVRFSDGMVDDRPEVFRPDWGLIIFPEREPFNSNRHFEDANGNRTDTLAVKVPILYNYMSNSDRYGSSVYYLEMRYWIREE